MRIDVDDVYVPEVDELLRESSRDALKERAVEMFGAYEDLSIAELMTCAEGDFEPIFRKSFAGTWAQVYWCKGFGEFVQSLPDRLKALTPPMDSAEQRASEGLMGGTLAESLVVFARNYFGLHSFREAERITIGEILIAKKACYNEAVFQRRLSKIRIDEAKRHAK